MKIFLVVFLMFSLLCSGCYDSKHSLSLEEMDCLDKLDLISDSDTNKVGVYIMKAIDNNWFGVIDKLMQMELLDITIPSENILSDYSVLQYSVMQNNTAMVRYLIDLGVNPDNGSLPPLCEAIINDNLEIVKILVEAGAMVNKETTEIENVMLYVNDNLEIAQYLLEHGANPNSVGYEGITPLRNTGSLAMAKLLVQYGAEMVPDNYNETPLYTAVCNLNGPLAEYYIGLGADVNSINSFGETPLFRYYQILSVDNIFMAYTSCNVLDIDRMLIEKTDNVNLTNNQGQSLLHFASAVSCYDTVFVQELIDKGAKVNVQDNEGKTPAHFAAKSGNVRVLQVLLKHGTDLTIKDNEGNTAFDVFGKHYSFTINLRQ